MRRLVLLAAAIAAFPAAAQQRQWVEVATPPATAVADSCVLASARIQFTVGPPATTFCCKDDAQGDAAKGWYVDCSAAGLDESASPTWTGAHTFTNPITVGGFRPIPSNAQLVTVCVTGPCDYRSAASENSGIAIQHALNATTGSKTNPVVILLLPGVYRFDCGALGGSTCDPDGDGWRNSITLIPSRDSYKSIQGWSRDSVVIASNDQSLHNVTAWFSPSANPGAGVPIAGAGNLVDFAMRDLTLEHSEGSDCFAVSVGAFDDRFSATVDNVRFRCSWDGIVSSGTTVIAPTEPPSELIVTNSLFDIIRSGINVSGHLATTSRGNLFASWTGTSQSDFTVPGSLGILYPQRGIAATTSYQDVRLVSHSDRFDLILPSGASGVSASANAPGDIFAYSIQDSDADIYSAAIAIRPATGNTSPFAGAGILTTGEYGTVVVSSPTIRYQAPTAGQLAYAAFHGGASTSLTVRDLVTVPSFGAGTEYDLRVNDTVTGPYGEVLLAAGTRFRSLLNSGGLAIRNFNPKVASRRLAAKDSVATPATAAAFDALSEYRLFDASGDENASWRNERVGRLYETASLFTPRFRVLWKPDSASSGTVVWRVGICAAAEDGAFPCSVSSFASVTDAVCGTCVAGDLHVSAWTDLPTGVLGKSKALVVQAQRDADNGSDTMTGDAALVAVEIQYGVD